MSRRQKKKQEKKRLAKIGILSQKEIQKQRLKEAKREARERRKGIPTRKEREKGIELAEKLSDLFENDTVETNEVTNKKIYNYKYFISKSGAQTPAQDGYTYIAHLFLLDDGSPADWEHTFTEDELNAGNGSGFTWARGNM